MCRYRAEADAAAERTGVLLVNLGTPDAPETAAVRRYLAEFLADPRVVEMPRWLWLPILYGVILRIRPARSARAYARVWTEEGSPLLVYSRGLQARLAQALAGGAVEVELAMRYGNPSIPAVLDAMRARGLARLLVLPLYPQYSATTTASVFDAIAEYFTGARRVPELRFVARYWEEPTYLDAIAASVREHWAQHGEPAQTGERLLFSFHGIPQRYVAAGDPYANECLATAAAVVERLALDASQWQVCFQSRVGREPWLQPYTDKTLEKLPGEGVRRVALVCPGFAADCLETLEENAMENRDLFLEAGGETFHYIPALNDSAAHVRALGQVIARVLALPGETAQEAPRDTRQEAGAS